MNLLGSLQGELFALRPNKTARISSWDQTGANKDYITVGPVESRVLADIVGAGCIRHIYFTMIDPDPLYYRQAVLRMFWDGEESPSVEVPLGDFFCVGHCIVRPVNSLMVTVNPGRGGYKVSTGFNCYFPMPFSQRAKIELENQSDTIVSGGPGGFWYHIDFERSESALPDTAGRFHAQWRRENPTQVKGGPTNVPVWDGVNLSGEDNYVILEAKGQGHIVGLLLNVDNIAGGWYGEGDDMIFVDGDDWPPRYHGTGTEEVFGGGASPNVEYSGPYTGFHLVEQKDYSGKNSMYRWYIHDPIRFRSSVRMTIEHGHANNFENDYSSVAYWYQAEPHSPFPVLPPPESRIPIFPEAFYQARERKTQFVQRNRALWARYSPQDRRLIISAKEEADELFYLGQFDVAAHSYARLLEMLEKYK